MLKSLFPTDPILFFDYQTPTDKISTCVWNKFAVSNFLSMNGRNELEFIIGHPRSFPM